MTRYTRPEPLLHQRTNDLRLSLPLPSHEVRGEADVRWNNARYQIADCLIKHASRNSEEVLQRVIDQAQWRITAEESVQREREELGSVFRLYSLWFPSCLVQTVFVLFRHGSMPVRQQLLASALLLRACLRLQACTWVGRAVDMDRVTGRSGRRSWKKILELVENIPRERIPERTAEQTFDMPVTKVELAESSGAAGPSWPGANDTTNAAITAVAKSVGESQPLGLAKNTAPRQNLNSRNFLVKLNLLGPGQTARPTPPIQQSKSLLVTFGPPGFAKYSATTESEFAEYFW